MSDVKKYARAPIEDYVKPSLLLPEIFHTSKDAPGFAVRKVEEIASAGFFRAVELGHLSSRHDRDAIAKIAREHGIEVVQWMTEFIDRNHLDLCALDEGVRAKSVREILDQLPLAGECGASAVVLITGADPGAGRRAEAYRQLSMSLEAICEASSRLGMAVLVEPLDRFAHKKRLVGPAPEAIDLLRRLRSSYPSVGYAFDTAHTALNDENVLKVMERARDEIEQIHLSNAVLRTDDPLYGDHHMAPGLPGFLDTQLSARILKRAWQLGLGRSGTLRVAVEVRPKTLEDETNAARSAVEFLRDAIHLAKTS